MLGLIKEEGKNMNSEIISTEHLCLRHYKEEKDLSAMHRLLSDAAVNTFLPWFLLRTAEETASAASVFWSRMPAEKYIIM